MKKPIGKSGDDMTSKFQSLSRSLVQLEEGDIFGDSDDDEPYFRAQSESNAESSREAEEEVHTPSAATDSSSKHALSMLTGSSDSIGKVAPDTKSKNSKSNPTIRLNAGNGKYIVLYCFANQYMIL